MWLQPCSLDTYLRSNMSKEEQQSGGFDGMKQVFPYMAIGKTMDEDGEPTEYRFCLEDFSDSLLGGRNSLAWPWEQWQAALLEWNGDEKKALTSLSLSSAPDPPSVAFAKLQATWEVNGLQSGYSVLCRYLMADLKPLLRISQRRNQLVVGRYGISPYRDFPSVSSFAYQTMLRSAMDGSSLRQLRLFPLGPELTRLIRKNVTGTQTSQLVSRSKGCLFRGLFVDNNSVSGSWNANPTTETLLR